jgi:uncharacterized damage-inducible protein DinB
MDSDQRIRPPRIADERAMLAGWLAWHRDTLALKCAGLTAAQLAERSAAPSTLSLLGLVRHMADVERGWMRRIIAREDAPPIYYSESDIDGDLHNLESASVEDVFATWRAEIADAEKIVAAVGSLDELRDHPHHGRLSVRWILFHMVEEYARHNGHADLLRERIDGVTGE